MDNQTTAKDAIEKAEEYAIAIEHAGSMRKAAINCNVDVSTISKVLPLATLDEDIKALFRNQVKPSQGKFITLAKELEAIKGSPDYEERKKEKVDLAIQSKAANGKNSKSRKIPSEQLGGVLRNYLELALSNARKDVLSSKISATEYSSICKIILNASDSAPDLRSRAFAGKHL